MSPTRPPGRRLAGPALLLVVGLLGSGCGSQPPLSPPTGVDGLVIPTPSPQPGDFVRGVDNRWLPLAPGRRWTYAVSGRGAVTSLVSSVLGDPVTVAGVATTVVRDVERSAAGATVSTVDRYYAQDRAGNVWWFGRSGPDGWRAGVDGAEAGLAMPAHPRLGDGFLTGYAAGRPRLVDTVITLAASATTPYGRVTGGLRLEQAATDASRARSDASSSDPDSTTEQTYQAGVGLAQSFEVVGGEAMWSLTAVHPPVGG